MKKQLLILFLLAIFSSCREKEPDKKINNLPEYRIGGFPMEYVTSIPSEVACSLIENDDTIAIKYALAYGGHYIRQFYSGIDIRSKNWSCQLDEKLKASGSNILLSDKFVKAKNNFLQIICKRNSLIIGDELKVANLFKSLSNVPLLASYDVNWKECEDQYFLNYYSNNSMNNIDFCQFKEMKKAYKEANWVNKKTKNIEYFFTQKRCENLDGKDLGLNPKLYYRMRFEYENNIIVPKVSLMNPLSLFSNTSSL